MSLLKTKIRKEFKATEYDTREKLVKATQTWIAEFANNNFKRIQSKARRVVEKDIIKIKVDFENGSHCLTHATKEGLTAEFVIFWGKERNPLNKSNKRKS